MPRNTIGDPPFPPVVVIDGDGLFSRQDLDRVLENRGEGVSICLRYEGGARGRGGYFFHFAQSKVDTEQLMLHDFEGRSVRNFSRDELVSFINHCTGRQFDEASFVLCQTELNFLKDEPTDA